MQESGEGIKSAATASSLIQRAARASSLMLESVEGIMSDARERGGHQV